MSVFFTLFLSLFSLAEAQNCTNATTTTKATGIVTLCDTRPAIVNDPTAPNEYATFVAPDFSDRNECKNLSIPLDWSKSMPLAAPLYDNLTYVITPKNAYCVAYITGDCTYDAKADPNEDFQMSCLADEPKGETVELFFIREEAYYQGSQLRCIQCGPKSGGYPSSCSFD